MAQHWRHDTPGRLSPRPPSARAARAAAERARIEALREDWIESKGRFDTDDRARFEYDPATVLRRLRRLDLALGLIVAVAMVALIALTILDHFMRP